MANFQGVLKQILAQKTYLKILKAMLGKLPTNLDKIKPGNLSTKYLVELELNQVLIRIRLVVKSQNWIELLIN